MRDDKLFTVPEVAERLRVDLESVGRWLRQGRLRGVLFGGTRTGYRVAASEVERFIREGGMASGTLKEAGERHTMTEERKEMTVSEAGRLGGNLVKAKYGNEFYRKIGQKGGMTVAEERGVEFYAAIGRKGGAAVRDARGADFYSEIGRKGGAAVRAKHGLGYYSRIGKVGGSRKKKEGTEG
ncbi:MAG: helix-turn-helix domain-containing protein [Chloroflexi bacterium]|nr:helix-turn-helix domain-containing protein [Chloroflexota bacterium]